MPLQSSEYTIRRQVFKLFGAAFHVYDGNFCIPLNSHLIRHYSPPAILPTTLNSQGQGWSQQPFTQGDFLGDTQPGVTIYYQFWYRDSAGPCGSGANVSSGLSAVWQP